MLQKCRKWAGQVGEIEISDDANPSIGIQLSGVDTESIIEPARINDNEGNRRRLIREMVFDAFGIRDDNQLFVEHELVWRGTRRRVEVQALREAMDKPRPKGLPAAVQNLLIMVFREHGQCAYTFHGGPFDDVTLKEIRDDLVLIKQELAEPEQWKKAVDHAGALFGLTINPLRTANNQNDLQKQVLDAVALHVEACRTLGSDLTRQLDALGLSNDCNRLNNAKLATKLLETLQGKERRELVDALADVESVTSLPALAKSIKSASRVSNAIADNNSALLEKVWSGADPAGARIKRSVAEALAADELVTALAAALKQAQDDATDIITKPPDPEPPKPDPDPKPKPVPKGKKVLKHGSQQGLNARAAKRVLAEIQLGLIDGVTLDIEYKIIGEADD